MGFLELAADRYFVRSFSDRPIEQEMPKKMYEAKTIMEGLEDVKAGRTVDGEKAISDIRRKYGI